jgi:hypothetical protein
MMSLLLSQGVDIAGTMPILSQIGSVGFCVWFAWYTTTIALPAKDKQHREEREAAELRYQTERAQFVKDVREEREATILRFTAAIDRQNQTVDRIVEEMKAARENFWNGRQHAG